MGTVNYRDGIAILQLIIFPIILVAGLFIWKRAGWRVGSKIWRYPVTLSLIRIGGSISTLLMINNGSNTKLRSAVAVFQLIGLAPLLLTYVGLIKQMLVVDDEIFRLDKYRLTYVRLVIWKTRYLPDPSSW